MPGNPDVDSLSTVVSLSTGVASTGCCWGPSLLSKAARGYPPEALACLMKLLFKRIGAEFIGTFLLIFASAGACIVNDRTKGALTLVGIAASSGLAVMIVIFSTGHISGAHLNPSVTVAFAAIKHFPWTQVPLYFGAQISGSICASFCLKAIFQPSHRVGVTVPSGTEMQSLALEFIITFGLMFVVTAVSTDTRAVGELAGIAVGATVALNTLVAGEISGASMNPVRTLGPAIAWNYYTSVWVYILGPTMGTMAGAAMYTLVRLEKQDAPIRSFRK